MKTEKQTKQIVTSATIYLSEQDYADLQTAFDIMHKKSNAKLTGIPTEQAIFVRNLLCKMLGMNYKENKCTNQDKYDVYANIKSVEAYDTFKDIVLKMFPNAGMPLSMAIPCDLWVGTFTKPEYQDLLKATPSCIELKVLPQ